MDCFFCGQRLLDTSHACPRCGRIQPTDKERTAIEHNRQATMLRRQVVQTAGTGADSVVQRAKIEAVFRDYLQAADGIQNPHDWNRTRMTTALVVVGILIMIAACWSVANYRLAMALGGLPGLVVIGLVGFGLIVWACRDQMVKAADSSKAVEEQVKAAEQTRPRFGEFYAVYRQLKAEEGLRGREAAQALTDARLEKAVAIAASVAGIVVVGAVGLAAAAYKQEQSE